MTPKLLSPEELEDTLGECHNCHPEEADALRAHIAALQADNARLLEVIKDASAYCVRLPKDLSDALLIASTVEHPGATLLSEHAKALVRARNEGLERAAVRAVEDAETAAQAAATERARRRPSQIVIQEALLIQVAMSSLAARLRAMKETEP